MSKKNKSVVVAAVTPATTTSTPEVAGSGGPTSSLPARPIKTVVGTAASAGFKGIGTMVDVGIPGGLRRNAFQDQLLAWNETKAGHRSDEELARLMDAEHPRGGVRIADRPELVAVIRKFYNAGKHGKQQGGVPETPSLCYEPIKKAEKAEKEKKTVAA